LQRGQILFTREITVQNIWWILLFHSIQGDLNPAEVEIDLKFIFASRQMKIAASILSFYILILTAIPCVDVHHNILLSKAELTQSKTDHQHNDFDRCSPFCTCDCCTSRVIQKDNVIQYNCCSLACKCIVGYSSTYVFSTHTTIWHPPKIG
jgi:hypothetical protein